MPKDKQKQTSNKQEFRRQTSDNLTSALQSDSTEDQADRKRIVSLSFFELKEQLAKGAVTAVQAVKAYQTKALELNDEFNCVTEFVREAVVLAEELDQLTDGEKAKMPLFGMPFSVKDNFNLKGYDTTVGLAKNLGDPAAGDCTWVALLRQLGAVPFVKTNVPQTLMAITCSNPVWGTTSNPYDKKRSPGGSSGGEACLVALGGTPFGIGSDLAGSLRIPAHFSGVCTLKCTSGRFKMSGAHYGVPGAAMMALGYGYFAQDVEVIEHLMSLTLSQLYFKISPFTAPIPWSPLPTLEPSGIRIGYYNHDGWFNATPGCARALEMAKARLEGLGFDLYPFEVPRPFDAFRLGIRCLMLDNGAYLLDEQYKFEKIDPHLKQNVQTMKIPLWVRDWVAFLIHRKYRRLANVMYAFNKGLTQAREAQAQALDYRHEFLEAMRQQRLDALICPAMPIPAIPHNYASKLFPACFSVFLYNLLDFPAGVVPMTKISDKDVDEMNDYGHEDMLDGYVKDIMKGAQGLPVGVQAVTLPYREELCLSLMKLLKETSTSDAKMTPKA